MKVFHLEHAAGVDARILAFLDWWGRLGPFPVTVPPDGGLRTDAVQAVLYAKGRTTPGPHAGEAGEPELGRTVTNAATVHDTPHGRGAAVDLLPVKLDPSGTKVLAIIDNDKGLFRMLGLIGEQHNFVWGGRFHRVDEDHLELQNWRNLPLLGGQFT